MIGRHLPATPLFEYDSLSEIVGTRVWVKHENHQPVGAFKVRGGINLIARLPDEDKKRGVIAASTGNHGQSVAYAARAFGVKATVCAPEQANPVKVDAMRRMGAEVILCGERYDDARRHCEELAHRHGYRYIHSGDEPLLIAGVATVAWEIVEAEPAVNVIIVPIGGGSCAAGACIVARSVGGVTVIGVQSESAPAAHESWTSRSLREAPDTTIAEGLATAAPFALPQAIMWELLEEFVLVPDEAIGAAVVTLLERTRNLVEPAGAATLACALALRERLQGQNVCLVASGGNVSPAQLQGLLEAHPV